MASKKSTVATIIMWVIMMILGMIVAYGRPDLLQEDSAFVGLAYAFILWVPAWVFGDLIGDL